MKRYPFLSLKDCNAPYIEEIEEAVCDVIESGWFLNGEQTKLFEKELAELCKTNFAIACSNGLDALRLIIRAYKELGLFKDGDEIIVPANTYIASVLAISDNGLLPVFVEPSEMTMNLDIDKIEAAITPRTRAIMVVHLYGSACWSEKMNAIAGKYKLKIIEDNAQAIGATAHCNGLNGTGITGGLGDAAGFSFYPTKNIGAMGDAGAIITNDSQLASTVKAIANYGSDRRYHNIYKGLNCRIDEIQAAILRVKLRHLDEITAARRKRAEIYDSAITNPLITKPLFDDGAVWHQYEIRINDRDKFREYLADNGVETDIHYAVPPYLQPCYYEFSQKEFPITRNMADTVVSLPISEGTPITDIKKIAEIINRYR